MAFNAIEAFQQGQEYHEPDVWQKYEEFDIDILDFADTLLVLLGHQENHDKYDFITIETRVETEPIFLKDSKHVLGSVQRECSWLVQCK